MARFPSRKKPVPQKRKADSSESDDHSLLPEEVDNATGIDLPNNNSAVGESKEEEQDAAKNIVQGPKKNPAPDGNDRYSSSSGSGGDGEGVVENAGARRKTLTRS